VAAVALVAGLAVALAQRQAALRERDEAERQTAVAEAVKNFLNEDVIRAASPFLKTSLKDVTVREAIERGAGKIDGRFKGQPAVELETRIELGALFLQIGEPDRAEAQYRAAVQLGSASVDVPAAKAQLARYSLAQALAQRSKNDEAKTLLEATDKLAQAQDERDPRLSSTRNSAWGTYYYHLGNPLKALPYYERSVADFIRWQPDNELVLASRMINLASVKLTTGDIEAGERGVREAMASLERSDGKQTFGYGMALSLLGRMRFFRHDYAGAEQLCTQAATMLRAILGGDVAFVADAVTILSRLQTATGRYAEAADSARLVYEAYLSSIGATGFNTQVYRMFLGHAEYLAGQRELGLKTSEEGLVALSAIVPPDHISLQLMKFHLASDYLDFDASRSTAARTIVDALDVDALQRISPEGDWPARLAALHGQIAFYDGDRERARGLLEPAIATMTQMNSARFEIERAQRTLQKLDDRGR
ncbi:MAG: hypothetical protein IJI03_01945, partial [Rudaea sp.]|nr:hypothetical protein [Rudaea sp.]